MDVGRGFCCFSPEKEVPSSRTRDPKRFGVGGETSRFTIANFVYVVVVFLDSFKFIFYLFFFLPFDVNFFWIF